MRIPLIAGRRFTSADRTGAPPVAVINESMARRVLRRSGGGARPARSCSTAAAATASRSSRSSASSATSGTTGSTRRRARDVHAARADVHVPDAHGGAHRRRSRGAGRAGARRALRRRSGGAGGRPAAAADAAGRHARPAAAARGAAVGVRGGGRAAERGRPLRRGGACGCASANARSASAWPSARRPARGRATSSAGACCRPATGMLVGMPAALALSRFMEGLVFGVTTRDPLTFALLPLLLTVVAGAACYLPARRAVARRPGDRHQGRGRLTAAPLERLSIVRRAELQLCLEEAAPKSCPTWCPGCRCIVSNRAPHDCKTLESRRPTRTGIVAPGARPPARPRRPGHPRAACVGVVRLRQLRLLHHRHHGGLPRLLRQLRGGRHCRRTKPPPASA